MSDLEGQTSRVIDDLTVGAAPALDDEARDVLAWFIALQWTRHRYTLAVLRRAATEGAALDPESAEWAYVIKSLGLVSTVMPLLAAWALRGDPNARPKETWNAVVESLNHFNWRLVRYRRPSLVISDNVVCLSGVALGETADAPTPAWTMHGIGVGFRTCQRITVPLDPRLGLLLERERDPQHLAARRFNRHTVFNSREFIASDPQWPAREPSLHAAMIADLGTQRFLAPAFADTT